MTVEGQSLNDLAVLMGSDTDSFNRWDASQRLGMQSLLAIVEQIRSDQPLTLDPRLVEAARRTLSATDMDQSVQAYTLALPSEVLLSEEVGVIDPDVVHAARSFARTTLATALGAELTAVYKAASIGSEAGATYTFSQAEVGCAFFGRNLHSRMPLDPTHVRLKRTRV
jgi:aminopeptidase N